MIGCWHFVHSLLILDAGSAVRVLLRGSVVLMLFFME